MPESSSINIIYHRFHVNNDKGELGIGYDMIIFHDLMLQIGHTADFKSQVFQWDGKPVYMNEPINLLGQSDLTKGEMSKVVIQTVEPASTQEATEWMVKILNSTYAKADLEQVVSNAIQKNGEERTLLLLLLKDFEYLFDGNLGNWVT